MIKETSLCMGCMNDKTYEGVCRLCGYSDDMPCIPTYLRPKTFLNERYIVGKVISYNGEGAVYIGYDTATGTKVTIKEFMPDTLCSRKKGETDITVNPDMLPLYKTYMSEFEDLNKTLMKSRGMSHLQTVLDVFSENSTSYVVYEYINGITLKTYLANSSGELTWEQVKELFPPIFTTLSLVHGAGVLHRGISPSTIFVTDKMELKLTGFSISAARTTNTEIACEVFAGCAAPEQYTSNNINGTWTDVYGIAAVLYRVLTGCMPAEAIARTHGSLLEPMMINRNIPPYVSKVIMQGLALSTNERIRTINEFVDKLFAPPRYNGIDQDDDRKPLTEQQRKKLRKKRKERAKTIAVLVIAGLVLIAFAIVFALTLNGAFDPGETGSSGTQQTQETQADSAAFTYDSSETSGGSETSSAVSSETSVDTSDTSSQISADANILMPDFTNRRYETTMQRYEGTFTFIPKFEYSDEYSAGLMYDQSIEAGTLVSEGTQIEIKVSKGRSLVPLPDYTDKPIDEYVAELNKLNIKYSVKTKQSNDAPNGYVAECSKEIGDLVNVEAGENITVYVAENFTEESFDVTDETQSESVSAQSGEGESENTGTSDTGIPADTPPEE